LAVLTPVFYFSYSKIKVIVNMGNKSGNNTLTHYMKNQIQNSLMRGIKELHIKILQSDNLAEIGNYLHEILEKVTEVPPDYAEKLRSKYWKDMSKADIIGILKNDIKSILDTTNSRAEIARYKATLSIAWLKGLFADPTPQ
jgi:ERCC4-type nuclease